MNIIFVVSTLIIFLSFLGESIFGFGGGLISIPLLSLLIDVKDAVNVVLIFQFLMGLLIIKSYKDISWKIALSMTIGLIVGTLLGLYMLSIIPPQLLRKILAISIFIFLIKMVFLKGLVFGKDKKWGLITGIIGGWFQGIIGTGGPIFTMYLTVVLQDKISFRATLIYLFFLTSVIRLLFSIPSGLISNNVFNLTVPIIPFFLIAIYIGNHVHKKIDEKYYKYAVELILLFAAISLLIK